MSISAGDPARRKTGIEGKWEALQEEREELRQKMAEQAETIRALQAQVAAIEALPDNDFQKGYLAVAQERDSLQAQLDEAGRSSAADLFKPDEDEQEALDSIQAFLVAMQRMGLRANTGELFAAVHVLQGFVLQRIMQRLLPPGQWSHWFDLKKG